jgi:hypothetical protein
MTDRCPFSNFFSFSVIAIFVICKLFLLPQNRKYWPFQPPACPQLDYFQPQPLICDLPTVGKNLNQKVKHYATSHQKVNTVGLSVCLTTWWDTIGSLRACGFITTQVKKRVKGQ